MTIANGAIRSEALRAEYGGATPMRLGDYRRGHAAGWVKDNAANNLAANLSAAVPLADAPLRLGAFRSQAKGWKYTNLTVRHAYDVDHPSYHCHVEFGDDWNGSTWPCFYDNSMPIGSSSTAYHALVIIGRANGPFTFTNKHYIDGAGGILTSEAGQAAIYVTGSVDGANRPIIVNSRFGQIRGGGGAGGQGGVGGTGSGGLYWVYEPGPEFTTHYQRDYNTWRVGSDSIATIIWYGGVVYSGANIPGSYPPGDGWTYKCGALAEYYVAGPVGYNGYALRREMQANAAPGGPGGAGGAGGVGQGYNQFYVDGAFGAMGGAGATWAGGGGQGGKGGQGGNWGLPGATGATGSTPNNFGGQPLATAGGPGTAGGAGGNAIYADLPWGLDNRGSIIGATGPVGPT